MSITRYILPWFVPLAACGGEGFDVLVTIQDPLGIAKDATSVHVGERLDALEPRALGDLAFNVTIGVKNSGATNPRTFWSEARAGDTPLARGVVDIDFAGEDRVELDLRALCDAQQICPEPVSTSICCVGPNICVGRNESCPVNSTPTLVGFALAYAPGQRATVSGFNVPATNGNNDGFTLEAWVEATACDRAECEGSFVGKAGDFGLKLAVRQQRATLSARVTNESSARASPQASATFELGRWVHTAVTYDGAQVSLYLDGQRVAGNPFTGPLARGTDAIVMGHPEASVRLDEVRIWSYARSEEQLRATSQVRLRGDEPGLDAYWPLDEGEGQTAFDATDRGRDAILGSGPTEDPNDPTWVRRVDDWG